jgi:iron complex outermembrane receptor protein
LIEAIDASNGIVASPRNTTMATDVRNENDSTVYGVSLKAEWDIGGGYTLTNVLAHRRSRMRTSIDTDTTTADLFNTNTGGLTRRQTTEELRLTSPSEGRFSYQLGFFYLDLLAREYLLQGANLGIPIIVPGLSNFGRKAMLDFLKDNINSATIYA